MIINRRKPMARIMIINWKFGDYKKATNKHNICDIEGGTDDKLICCNYDDASKLGEIITDYDKKFNELLLMLHSNAPNDNVKRVDVGSCDKAELKICDFAGGSDPIYYVQDKRPKGLLGENDLVKIAKTKNKIKKEHFDFVWNHYWKLCKKKLYELKEDLLFCLYPLSFQDKAILSDYLNKEMLIELRIKDFVNKTNEEEKIKIKKLEEKVNNYFLFSDCHGNYQQKGGDLYINLKRTLEHILSNDSRKIITLIKNEYNHIFPEPSIKTIPEFIRYQFDELLNTLDEPVY